MMQKVYRDLERAAADSYFANNRTDRFRLERAKQQINEFQTKWSNGRYDSRELNDVVVALQSVVDRNTNNWRDREVLREDLDRLRRFRSWREGSFRDHPPEYVPGYRR